MVVRVLSTANTHDIVKAAVPKHSVHGRFFDGDQEYSLLFHDGTEVLTIPGKPDELFQLDKYQNELGKPYNRISLFLARLDSICVEKSGDEKEHGVSCTPGLKADCSSVVDLTTIEEKSTTVSKPSSDTSEKTDGKNYVTLREIFPKS